MDVRTKFCRLVGSTLLFSAFVFQNLAAADDSVDPVGAPQATNPGSLGLLATATLTADQITQPEVIFLYSFALPPGQPSFLGLKGAVSLTSDMPVFNESLNTVATNISGPCPADGSVYPNYAAIYAAYPNLFPLQSRRHQRQHVRHFPAPGRMADNE